MTNEAILQALSNVQEPDLGKDLVTLNMVKDITIDGNNVAFTIVLTTPACPMKDMMRMASENAIKLLVNKAAVVTVNFTANTSSNRNSRTRRTRQGRVFMPEKLTLFRPNHPGPATV